MTWSRWQKDNWLSAFEWEHPLGESHRTSTGQLTTQPGPVHSRPGKETDSRLRFRFPRSALSVRDCVKEWASTRMGPTGSGDGRGKSVRPAERTFELEHLLLTQLICFAPSVRFGSVRFVDNLLRSFIPTRTTTLLCRFGEKDLMSTQGRPESAGQGE